MSENEGSDFGRKAFPPTGSAGEGGLAIRPTVCRRNPSEIRRSFALEGGIILAVMLGLSMVMLLVKDPAHDSEQVFALTEADSWPQP